MVKAKHKNSKVETKRSNVKHCDTDCSTGPEARHGWTQQSRGAFLLAQGWLGQWGGVNAFEGGKNFPTQAAAGLNYSGDDGAEGSQYYAPPPEDGYICSGGHTDRRDIVNYTDSELQTAKGVV